MRVSDFKAYAYESYPTLGACMYYVASSSAKTRSRSVFYVSDTQIYFGLGQEVNGTSTSGPTTYCVPLAIYGIK